MPAPATTPTSADASDTVVLLHGLLRSPLSMRSLARRLERAGYVVRNVGYPSWRHGPERLLARLDSVLAALDPVRQPAVGHVSASAADHRDQAAADPGRQLPSEPASPGGRVHFVTHSLGGILVRAWLARSTFPALGRVVMLAPPNAGSEVVDRLGSWRALLGPTGRLLGTCEGAWPGGLPPAGFQLGIIAGNRSLNPILSRILPGENDGSVSVASTWLPGAAFLTVPHSHTFIMRSRRVHEEVLSFLRTGHFRTVPALSPQPDPAPPHPS